MALQVFDKPWNSEEVIRMASRERVIELPLDIQFLRMVVVNIRTANENISARWE